jgi:nucleotide-binding universal stress UspA family protein
MAPVKLHRFAVAIDGSKNGAHALEYAIELAKRYSGELVVLAVAPIVPVNISPNEPFVPAGVPPNLVAEYRTLTEAAVKKAQGDGVKTVTGVTYEGVVVDEIVNHLEEHPADLVVVGSRGLSTAKRILLGSVSTGVVTHAPCPVLVVRPLPATKPARGGG